jgi:hypothetical protein
MKWDGVKMRGVGGRRVHRSARKAAISYTTDSSQLHHQPACILPTQSSGPRSSVLLTPRCWDNPIHTYFETGNRLIRRENSRWTLEGVGR